MDIKRLQELAGVPLTEAYKPASPEDEAKSARADGVKDAEAGRQMKNASDMYGPYGGDYQAGYRSVEK